MAQSISFDVDGTIINSRELITKAYAQVGVTIPDGAWGLSWRDWLIDYCGGVETAELIHRQKIEAYTELIMRTDLRQYELPAARIARTWLSRHGVPSVTYLTAGSAETAFAVVSRLAAASTLHGELTYAARLQHLRALPPGTIYLDDNLNTITRLAVDTPNVRLVAVTGQSYDDLMCEVYRCHSEIA